MKFISKDLSIKLKEKGFDRPCFGFYKEKEDKLYLYGATGNVYSCLKKFEMKHITNTPTIDQVLEWLREKDIIVYCKPYHTMATKNHIMYEWNVDVFNIDTKETKEDNKNVCLTYVDNDFGYVRYSSFDCIADYDDAILASINFIVEYLI
jgi:hypothetical protein